MAHAECRRLDNEPSPHQTTTDSVEALFFSVRLTCVLADTIAASGSLTPDSVAHISGDQYSNTLSHSSSLFTATTRSSQSVSWIQFIRPQRHVGVQFINHNITYQTEKYSNSYIILHSSASIDWCRRNLLMTMLSNSSASTCILPTLKHLLYNELEQNSARRTLRCGHIELYAKLIYELSQRHQARNWRSSAVTERPCNASCHWIFC